MAIKRSTGLRNALAQGFGVREVLRDGRLRVYDGVQPANADAAPAGVLLCEYTLAGGTYTGATRASAALVFSGSSGSVTTLKVGGMAFNLIGSSITCTSASQIASAVSAAVNALMNPLNIIATVLNDTVTLYAPHWMGANANDLTIAVGTSGGDVACAINGASADTLLNGVSAVNGLNFLFPAVSGVLSKEAGQWQGTSAASGTSRYFRYVAGGSIGDGTAGDIVFDGSIATSGGDLTMGNLSMEAGAVQTISTFTITMAT